MPIVAQRPQHERSILIKGAGVITMDATAGDLLSADILVRDGKVAEIAPEISAPDADIIDAGAMIAMPGFVDGHRHLWEGVIRGALPTEDLFGYFRTVNDVLAPAVSAEDAYVSTLASALGALDAGITTMFDWSHVQTTPDHTAACIAGLRESGMRAVFGFGLPGAQDRGHRWPQDIHRLLREEFTSSEQLLSLALASVSPEHVPDEMAKANFALARDAGVIISIHSGMAGMGTPNQIERYGKEGPARPGRQSGPLQRIEHGRVATDRRHRHLRLHHAVRRDADGSRSPAHPAGDGCWREARPRSGRGNHGAQRHVDADAPALRSSAHECLFPAA